MSADSSVKTSTIIIASAGALVTGLLAYAVYFDYKRHTDPQFRRALKRSSRREARVAKEEAEAQGVQQKRAIKRAVEEAREEGFPTDVEEKEAYFMTHVSQGEALAADESSKVEAALSFYKALKVWPQPNDLINIYDKTVPKPVIDVLAEMIALDPSIKIESSLGGSSSANLSSPPIDD